MSATIFGFSAETGEKSSQISVQIAQKVADIMTHLTGEDGEMEDDAFEKMHYLVRKGAHFTEFAILGILCFLLAKSYGLPIGIVAIAALSYCLLFAIGDELHQLFVDDRVGSAKDVCIDFSGSFTGVAICMLIHVIKKRKKFNFNRLFISV